MGAGLEKKTGKRIYEGKTDTRQSLSLNLNCLKNWAPIFRIASKIQENHGCSFQDCSPYKQAGRGLHERSESLPFSYHSP